MAFQCGQMDACGATPRLHSQQRGAGCKGDGVFAQIPGWVAEPREPCNSEAMNHETSSRLSDPLPISLLSWSFADASIPTIRNI